VLVLWRIQTLHSIDLDGIAKHSRTISLLYNNRALNALLSPITPHCQITL
jgi:hypothetical protein